LLARRYIFSLAKTVPIHPKIQKAILKYYNKASDILFFKDNNKPISQDYYRNYIYYPALNKLGIKRKSLHSTRHTFASILAHEGADTESIKKLLGHTKYSFTADTYTHTDISKLKTAINLIKT